MDVTFAGNSNEVTPCKIEFNYRNNFDNYTRWKLREVIKVVQGVLDFRDDWVQKKFPDNRNPDNRGTTILRIEIPIIEESIL